VWDATSPAAPFEVVKSVNKAIPQAAKQNEIACTTHITVGNRRVIHKQACYTTDLYGYWTRRDGLAHNSAFKVHFMNLQ